MNVISEVLIFLAVALVTVGSIYYFIMSTRLSFGIRIKYLGLCLLLFELSLVSVVYIERPNDLTTIALVFIILTCANGLFLLTEWLKNYFKKNRK